MPDLLRAEGNERLDLSDFRFVQNSIRDHGRHVGAEFLANPTGNRAWILSGFGITDPAVGKQVEVTRGRALLALRDGAQVLYGFVTTEGDATKIVDLTGQPAGTYSIYIRFEFVDGASGSRVFWNAAGSGNEFTQSINTRQQAQWSLRVEQGTPGSEWLKIGEVDQVTMAITDQRPFYFEGTPDSSYATTWGGGNDRNADRQQYGITDLQTFTEAMRTCLEDIKGSGSRWWDNTVSGINIGFTGPGDAGVLRVGDSAYNLRLDGANPRIDLAGGNDYLLFDRTANQFEVRINNNTTGQPRFQETRMTLGPNFGLDLASAGLPILEFDTSDQMRYDRGANTFEFTSEAGANVTHRLLRASVADQGGYHEWNVSTRQYRFGVRKSEATAGDQDFYYLEWNTTAFPGGGNKLLQLTGVELDVDFSSMIRLPATANAPLVIGSATEGRSGTPVDEAFRLYTDGSPTKLVWSATYNQVFANIDSQFVWEFEATDFARTIMTLESSGGAEGDGLLTVDGQVYPNDLSIQPANATQVKSCAASKQCVAWGVYDTAGVVATPHYNMNGNASKGGTGIYDITFNVALNANCAVVVSSNAGSPRIAQGVITGGGSTMRIRMYDVAGVVIDSGFNVAVFGTT